MSGTIVVVEDEEDILELIEYNLQKEGYETIGFLHTKHLEELLEEERVDLMIMDRNLPNIEGARFVKRLREKGCGVPVIFLSAKNADEDIEEGFELGGDDYITKPFNMKELLLRIRALLRRTNPIAVAKTLDFRDMRLNLEQRKLTIEGRHIELSKLEFDLLYTLIKNHNVVLSRERLLENVWGKDALYQDKTVNVAINRLKEKIDPDKSKEYIKTIRGVGYTVC